MDRPALPIDETTARRELTEGMLMAGAMAYHEWIQRREADQALSVDDLVAAIWVAFRRARSYPNADN